MVITGMKTESFRIKVWIGRSSHCVLERELKWNDTSASEAGERIGAMTESQQE